MEVDNSSLTKEKSYRRQTPPWADLPPEVLEIIIAKLPFFYVPFFKSICSSWCRAALNSLSSPLCLYHSQSPLLMLHKEESFGKSSVFFYTLKDKAVYEYKNVPRECYGSSCIGSSHGSLVLLDRHADPFLLNIFSRSLIKLPPKENLRVYQTPSDNFGSTPHVEYNISACFHGNQCVLKTFKSRLSFKKQFCPTTKKIVIIIYGKEANLGYCWLFSAAWTQLQGQSRLPYIDILCSKNKLHALQCDNSIGVWDLNGYWPVKVVDIRPALEPSTSFSTHFYSTRRYLVESSGDILLVLYVLGDVEAELLVDKDTQPLSYPYRTLDFKAYKLDFEHEKWSELESLGDRALFLGMNHSVSLSVEEHREFKGNSIYFTDWKQIDRNDWYGGHVMGVYSMEDGSISPFPEIDYTKIETPPFWVVPCT